MAKKNRTEGAEPSEEETKSETPAEEAKSEAKPEVVQAGPAKGPMTMLAEMKASGKSEADAAAEIVEKALDALEAPKGQAKAFAKLIQEALTAKAITGVQGKPCEPYYRCQAVTPHGVFHAIGRKFTSDPKDASNKVLVKGLSPAQITELEGVLPKFLSVVKICFE